MRYPPYGALPDPRADQALDLLRERQQPDGRWHLAGQPMWRTGPRTQRDAVDWGRSGPSPMLTLNALRILRAVGRMDG